LVLLAAEGQDRRLDAPDALHRFGVAGVFLTGSPPPMLSDQPVVFTPA